MNWERILNRIVDATLSLFLLASILVVVAIPVITAFIIIRALLQ